MWLSLLQNCTWKQLLKLAAIFGVMFGAFFLFIYVISDPIDPVTAEHVWDVLEDQGYDPIDTTQYYQESWSDTQHEITNAVTVATDEFEFNFFVLSTEERASWLYRSYRSYISQHRYSPSPKEHDTRLGNCLIYWVKAPNKYTVDIRIANTVLYAYCDSEDEEYMSKINEIVRAIGYFLN